MDIFNGRLSRCSSVQVFVCPGVHRLILYEHLYYSDTVKCVLLSFFLWVNGSEIMMMGNGK